MQAFYTAALRKALHFQLLMANFYTYLAVKLARRMWPRGGPHTAGGEAAVPVVTGANLPLDSCNIAPPAHSA